ncbi:hypothetical protein EET67_18365 [Pseudaminobacter arsenicus]|uniref:Uncharacterized protein n=1 Tax=Borborobacter arsenicus TaxID=1851146 RepID=A0A432V2H0_9HYPH|nr:hypothetical protein [Pseudaminobacter arsenicus]RUM96315.1 hypothetical protein EET67_18365 [Pseudaminobacter arsenicus]
MTDIDDDEIPKSTLLQRCKAVVCPMLLFASPIVSMGCAVMVGYFTYLTINRPPPADVSTLAISILRSDNVSPEMQDWATGALGLHPYMPLHQRVTN